MLIKLLNTLSLLMFYTKMVTVCDVMNHLFSYGNCIDNHSSLQFDEIFQHWFPKRSKSFVTSPFNCLMSILSIQAIFLSLESQFLISDGYSRPTLVFKMCSDSHLKDVLAFTVGYDHYPPVLMHSLNLHL